MDETQIMACSILIVMVCVKREEVLSFQKELCNEGLGTASGDIGGLHEPVGLPILPSAGCQGLEELKAVLQLEHHGVLY